VRLFNPLVLRDNRLLGALLDFPRSTRRMHNKSFTADNQIAIIGGRNIGDSYFQASARLDMADLDALVIGPTVDQLSGLFDAFWNSPGSFPIGTLSKRSLSPDEIAEFNARIRSDAEQMNQRPVGRAYAVSPLVEEIREGDIGFFWGNTLFLKCDPQKAFARSDDPAHSTFPGLKACIDDVHHEVLLISPYFVPARRAMDYLRQLRQRGLRVRILTNSMRATDVFLVFAFYSKYRRELLDMGAELYEFKPDAEHRPPAELDPSLRACLHAKVLTFDNKSIYVGSTNLDPRSVNLNTEAGVIFDCTDMTADLSNLLDERLLRIAYRVEAVPAKTLFGTEMRLNWVTLENGSLVRMTDEPGRTFWTNLRIFFLRMLPIEGQL
jgi:putative cardiolipin synthase